MTTAEPLVAPFGDPNQAPLFAADEIPVPKLPRPTLQDEEICRRVCHNAALEIIDEVLQWIGEGERDRDDIIEDLEKMFDHNPRDDGYERAKYLETWHSWSVDARLVEILDSVWIDSILDAFVKDWVKLCKIEPPYAVGTAVSYSDFKGRHEGEIVAIYAQTAAYLVCVPALGHVRQGTGTRGVVLDYEEVTPVETVQEDAP